MKPIAILLSLLTCKVSAQTLPETFQGEVSYNGETFMVEYVRHSSRSPEFEVQVQQGDGSFLAHEAGEVRTYLGSIAERPGAMVSAVRRAGGELCYRVAFETGEEWINLGGATSLRTDDGWQPAWPTNLVKTGGAGSGVLAAEVAVDLPYSQYAVDGDAAAALEMIEFSVNTTNLIYLRQAGAMNRIGRVIIRADAGQDPYAGMTDTGPLLSEIANQWNTVLPATFTMTHDLGLVATSATGGGLAYVGVVGSPGYSSNGSSSEGDFTTVWRHEVGHNWSLGHYDGGNPEGATINSGNQLAKMSGPEQAKVIAHRNARIAKLDNLGTYPLPIPPCASLDRAEFALAGSTTIDVLDNDHDGNGESFTITAFDAQSMLGATISRSVGTGPGGRDELVYQPPLFLPEEIDLFTYRITDTAGREAVGNVILRPSFDSDLLRHLTFDDGAGESAVDSSSHAAHGTLENGAFFSTGTIAGAVTLDGADDRVVVPAPGIVTDSFTVTGWIRRSGPQNGFTGIAVTRGSTTAAGLHFGDNNELRYMWNDTQWWWNSGLVVPDGVWTFVALSLSPAGATIFMDDGSGMQSATNAVVHGVEELSEAFALGRDPNFGSRHFAGELDDFRLYSRSLDAAEIARVAGGLANASSPRPAQYDSFSLPEVELGWTGSPSASAFRVFFSTDYEAVRDGVEGGPADLGTTPLSVLTSPRLSPLTTYYWRVDSTDGSGWAEGPVWTFSVVENRLLACG